MHDELSNTRTEEPASKRRRVDIAPSNNHPAAQAANGSPAGGNIAAVAAAEPVLLEIKDISISVPQRKKYDLCITKNFLYAKLNGSTAPAQGIVYAWKDIGSYNPIGPPYVPAFLKSECVRGGKKKTKKN